MVSMPYRWQKGAAWQLFELVLSTPDPTARLQHKRAVWKSLFDPVPLANLNALIAAEKGELRGQPVADAGVTDNAAAGEVEANEWVEEHLIPDWYGEDPRNPTTTWYGNPTKGTGWWSSWTGRPMEVVREAMLRALQVSFGDARPRSACAAGDWDDFDPGLLVRNWPIELWWNCPVGAFQASVAWRRHPPEPALPDSGVVSLTWMTPGTVPHNQVADQGPPAADPPVPPVPNGCQCNGLRWDLRVVCGCEDPVTASVLDPVLEEPAGQTPAHSKRRGSWIVGQTITQAPVAEVRTGANGSGQGFRTPNPPVTSWGPVVTVEPSQPDGGSRETGQWGMY